MNRAERRRQEKMERAEQKRAKSMAQARSSPATASMPNLMEIPSVREMVSNQRDDDTRLFETLQAIKDNMTYKDILNLSEAFGISFDDIMRQFLEIRENAYRMAAANELIEMVRKAECEACAYNVLAAVYSINMTWGFTKAVNRFMENLNAALDYIQKIGFRAAYEQAQKKMGIIIEFDDEELNLKYGLGRESQKG